MNSIYEDIYKDSMEYGSPYVSKGLRFSVWADKLFKNAKNILCVGCGNCYEVAYWLRKGKNVFGTELNKIKCDALNGRIIKALSPGLPFKDKVFDLLVCCEVIEHIEPDTTKNFVDDCIRASKFSLFSIATKMDPPYNTHINLKKAHKWLKFFEDKNLITFQFAPVLDLPEMREKHYWFADGIVAITKNI